MELRGINIDKIIQQFGSTSEFIKQLDVCVERAPHEDKFLLMNIIIYYNNLFEIPTEMKRDVIKCAGYKLSDRLYYMNKELKCEVLSFLIDLTAFNTNYVKNIRCLA